MGRAVLDNPAILIPEPGRADIADRRVDDPILTVLARLAESDIPRDDPLPVSMAGAGGVALAVVSAR